MSVLQIRRDHLSGITDEYSLKRVLGAWLDTEVGIQSSMIDPVITLVVDARSSEVDEAMAHLAMGTPLTWKVTE